MKNTDIEIGKNIAHFRKEIGLSQKQLSKQLGISQQIIANYELGQRRLHVPMLIKIAQTLHVYIEDLLPNELNQRKRGPRPKLDRELEKVKILPEEQQKAILNLIQTFTKTNRKAS